MTHRCALLLSLSALVLQSARASETNAVGAPTPTEGRSGKCFIYKGCVQWLGSYISLTCGLHDNPAPLEDMPFTRFDQPMRPEIVEFTSCSMSPTLSYAETLFTLNVDVAATEELRLTSIKPNERWALRSTHLKGLALRTFELGFKELTETNLDFLKPMTLLTHLTIRKGKITAFPESTGIKSMLLTEGVSVGAWGGCLELQRVHLAFWDVENIPSNWLSNCTKLSSLSITCEDKRPTEKIRRMISGAASLRQLSVNFCEPTEEFLNNMENVEFIDLSDNHLHRMPIIRLPSLKRLILRGNDLRFSRFLDGKQNVMSVPLLDLSGNRLFDLCDMEYYVLNQSVKSRVCSSGIKPVFVLGSLNTSLHSGLYKTLDSVVTLRVQYAARDNVPLEGVLELPALVELCASGTDTTQLCLEDAYYRLPALERLDLRRTKVTSLKFSGLPNNMLPRFELDLRDNRIQNVTMDQSDYEMLKKRNVTVLVELSLSCDCSDALFARALREQVVSVPGARCSDGRQLAQVAPENLACDKYACGERACTCRRSWSDNATHARCSGAQAVPREPGLRALHARNNRIQTLGADDLPDTLTFLDLSENHIKRLNDTAVAALFSVPERRVRLAGNPIICDCGNLPLLEALQAHRAQVPTAAIERFLPQDDGQHARWLQVQDYARLRCADKGSLLLDVTPAALCAAEQALPVPVPVLTLVASAFALALLTAIAAAFFYRHERVLKAYLFSRGCFLCWLREEEVDGDKIYDAFVSFSHKDEGFVVDELLPGLESGPHAYKLCLHSRDWLVGEWIAAQIAQSVEQSRRTIIVLSQHFVESTWGLHEFRTAHLSTLREGRRRIIVVVLDDVVADERLDKELRGYLNSNTYVRWDDKRFWDKLRYAMPHRSAADARATVGRSDHGEPGACATAGRSDHGQPGACATAGRSDHGQPGACATAGRSDHGEPGACATAGRSDHGQPGACATAGRSGPGEPGALELVELDVPDWSEPTNHETEF